jgi:arsenate reductase
LLDQAGADYRYREYRKEPLSAAEIRDLLALLELPARSVLRTRDRAFKQLQLTGDEPEAELIDLMSRHPTLLQRPIAVGNGRAVVGRPVERVLDVVSV